MHGERIKIIRRHFGKQMNKETKLRVHNITAKAALKFGSEAWVLKKREEQRLEAAQMKFLRHLLGITKLDKEKTTALGKKMNKETKLRIHNITAKAALKFGSEAWVLKKREEQRLEAAQMKFLRHLLGITKLDKEKTTVLGKKMNKETKLRIHNITAKAALKFGSEAWVLKKREEQPLEAAQMKFLRHLFGITKLDKEKPLY